MVNRPLYRTDLGHRTNRGGGASDNGPKRSASETTQQEENGASTGLRSGRSGSSGLGRGKAILG